MNEQCTISYLAKYVFQEKSSDNGTMGVSVSTLYNADYEKDCKIRDQDKTAFDWCKEGNIKEMTKILEKTKIEANVKDDQVFSRCTMNHSYCEHTILI